MAESSRRGKRNNRINQLEEGDDDGHCFINSEIINTPGFEGLKDVLEGRKVDYFYYNGQKMIPFNDLEVDLTGDHHMNQQVHPSLNERGNNESPPALANTSSQPPPKDDEIVSSSAPNTTIEVGLNSSERVSDLLLVVTLNAEPTRRKILELAYSAMEELAKIAFEGKPLWKTPKRAKYETLDDVEYIKEFGHVEAILQEIIDMVEDGDTQIQYKNASKMAVPSEALHIEASRDIAYIKMSPINIVELLMDLKQWSEAFCNIVSKAKIIGILSNGAEAEGSSDGRVQVMSSEFHLPTALVLCRECYFARYCKKLSDRKWGVVDVSLEKILPHPLNNYQRRPSGCIIEEMPEGYTKVTWVEHGQADYRELNINFKKIITSGFAFSATRWVACIVRHCEAHEILKAGVVNNNNNNISKGGKESMWKVGERMMRNFCEEMNGSSEYEWMKMQLRELPSRSSRVHHQYRFEFEEEVKEVRMRIKDNSILKEAGKPCQTTVVFSTSLCLPVSPTRLFHFLRDHRSRPKWDLLLTDHGLRIREHAYLIKGKDAANRVSILELTDARGKIVVHYLQESYTHISGSYVVYAPLEKRALSDVLEGEKNPDFVAILPSGFAILPWRIPKDGDSTASVLTVGFHFVDYRSSKSYLAPESVATMHKILRETVTGIKDAVFSNNLLNY